MLYVENPREGIKKPWFEQERNILDWLNLYYVLEREHYNKVSFLSYQLSAFIFQNIWFGSCPRSSAACSFYTSTKIGVKLAYSIF